MKIQIEIGNLGQVGLKHLFLALRDEREQVMDSNGKDKEVVEIEEKLKSVFEAGARDIGFCEFLDLVSKS